MSIIQTPDFFCKLKNHSNERNAKKLMPLALPNNPYHPRGDILNLYLSLFE
jgi:hypothetical protein